MEKTKPPGTMPAPSPEFLAREKRFTDAIALKTPDRVPVANTAQTFITRYAGITDAEAHYDYERLSEAFLQGTKALNADVCISPMFYFSGPVFEMLGTKTFKWPTPGKNENIPFQFVEDEFMKAEEYDTYLKDPSDFTVRILMPRMSKVFEPLGMMPPLRTLFNPYTHATVLPMMASVPPLVEMFKNLGKIGEEMERFNKARFALSKKLFEAGYPTACGASTSCPFDCVSDFLRGMRSTMFDLFREKDRLKKAVDLMLPDMIGGAIMQAQMSGNKRVFIPLHRGAGGFMSNEQFAEFYWPGLKALLLGLIDADLTPVPFFEGNYTPRLEFLAELPPGKICGHFDMVDKKKFKELLGDKMVFWGDVPAGLLIAGTVDEVKDYVKNLIDMFGGTGLIVDGAVESYPPESKPENVEAMIQTVFEYGRN